VELLTFLGERFAGFYLVLQAPILGSNDQVDEGPDSKVRSYPGIKPVALEA
jgi:hypothetical protein